MGVSRNIMLSFLLVVLVFVASDAKKKDDDDSNKVVSGDIYMKSYEKDYCPVMFKRMLENCEDDDDDDDDDNDSMDSNENASNSTENADSDEDDDDDDDDDDDNEDCKYGMSFSLKPVSMEVEVYGNNSSKTEDCCDKMGECSVSETTTVDIPNSDISSKKVSVSYKQPCGTEILTDYYIATEGGSMTSGGETIMIAENMIKFSVMAKGQSCSQCNSSDPSSCTMKVCYTILTSGDLTVTKKGNMNYCTIGNTTMVFLSKMTCDGNTVDMAAEANLEVPVPKADGDDHKFCITFPAFKTSCTYDPAVDVPKEEATTTEEINDEKRYDEDLRKYVGAATCLSTSLTLLVSLILTAFYKS